MIDDGGNVTNTDYAFVYKPRLSPERLRIPHDHTRDTIYTCTKK
jgi:hypothetical protein